ncbi:protein MEI2-like 4 isoform X2 [Rutidosis leptorrhynchoides]|uniref:protein MEI2-like 4 isoform X2 n=1 Tax=Rutidosis leptorrhynchoides TaxID=125765 RepID=UPI003A98EB6E
MQVAVKDQQDIYRPDFHLKERIGKLTVKADKQVTLLSEKDLSIFTNQSKTVESLLPDEEDLFSGVLDELACNATSNGDDEDFDLFNSSGGMELEGNCKEYLHPSNFVTAEGSNNDQSSSEHLKTCVHPSRALIVKNVDKRVKESELRFLFEQHGDIQFFYTTCRYQGFVIISYYDIRAATIAFTTLQNKLLEAEKLLIQYLDLTDVTSGQYIDQAILEVVNCDPAVSNDKLYQMFVNFGEIEEIWGSIHHRYIKYYDIRATEAAFNGLNSSNMLQEIKLEVTNPELAKSMIHQFTPTRVQGQLRSYQNPNGNSLPQVVNSCPKDEYIYGVHSPNVMAINANCCVTNSFPVSSIYDQFGHSPRYFTNQVNLHNHFPRFHPQSLPISCKGFVDSSIISHDCINLATVGFTTQTDDKQLHIFGPYANNIQFAGNTVSGLSGCHHSNSFQNHHLNPIWAHSPPLYDNSVCAHNTNNLSVSHKSPKRDNQTASPVYISRSLGRGRRISHGRRETVSCHTDEQKYELDIERVLSGEDCRTTLMIKNIPNKYSSTMLLAAINEHNQGTYDFLYLPLDFKNKCNMGYAFINMTDPLQIVKFHKSINGKKWEKFHSGKVACLAYARIQGKAALIAHFQESSLLNEDTCCHPILFTTDGPNAGNQEPFPLGSNIHSRRHKNRCNLPEVNDNQEISYQIKNCI